MWLSRVDNTVWLYSQYYLVCVIPIWTFNSGQKLTLVYTLEFFYKFGRILNFLIYNFGRLTFWLALPLWQNLMTKFKVFANDKINWFEIFEICFGKGRRTLQYKEKMLFTSIFSFSHNVLKRLLSQGCLKSWIVWQNINCTRGCNFELSTINSLLDVK